MKYKGGSIVVLTKALNLQQEAYVGSEFVVAQGGYNIFTEEPQYTIFTLNPPYKDLSVAEWQISSLPNKDIPIPWGICIWKPTGDVDNVDT